MLFMLAIDSCTSNSEVLTKDESKSLDRKMGKRNEEETEAGEEGGAAIEKEGPLKMCFHPCAVSAESTHLSLQEQKEKMSLTILQYKQP